MDYNRFMQLMEKQSADAEDIKSLQEFVNEFPYFQSAQALLARAMYQHQHVRYERQLKLASAYTADRKSLYELIHPKQSKLFGENSVGIDNPVTEEKAVPAAEEENIFEDKPEQIILPPEPPDSIEKTGEELTEQLFVDTGYPESERQEITEERSNGGPQTVSLEKEIDSISEYRTESGMQEDEEDEPPVDYDELPVSDPHEIIRRRLNEILGLHETKQEEVKNKPAKDPKVQPSVDEIKPAASVEGMEIKDVHELSSGREESIVGDEPNTVQEQRSPAAVRDLIDQIADESNKAVDIIDKAELEYALEASIMQSLEKLPVIEMPVDSEKQKTQEQKEQTFLGWLKAKSVSGYGKIEEVHAYDDEVPLNAESTGNSQTGLIPLKEQKDVSQLIDRFIKSDPKIVPSKTEFYSPASQAKKSITEDEDLVSETLAGIYYRQGNLLKARAAYQKLSLLYPEKMTYFAALILAIDKDINNLDKKDL